ncbi:hypothetical protein H6769_06325 [Candidatus Peribacteria bacterium]|nr:hypothetical protein [Candidatus Peribacteria bacterium]
MSKVTRRECREVLFQCLYSAAFNRDESLDTFLHTFFHSPRFITLLSDSYFLEMYSGVRAKSSELSRLIAHFAPKFELPLISIANLLSVYIASYEMLYLSPELRPDTRISINEGIGLSKTFCDESNKRLTNGVLHSISADLDASRAIALNATITTRDIYSEDLVADSAQIASVRLEDAFLAPTQKQLDRASRRTFDIDSLSVTQNIRQSQKNV